MVYTKSFIFSLFIIILLSSCIGSKENKEITKIDYERISLKSELNEISGLHYLDSNTLLGVQDEKGKIYFINSENGEIKKTFMFGNNGDFEGIANKDTLFYVLRSDGTVIKFDGKLTQKCSFMSKKNFDFEGLYLNDTSQELLIACKRHGKKEKRKDIWIYQIDLMNFSYKKEALFQLNKKKFGVSPHFQPSAISMDPKGNLIILSSYSHEVLVIDKKGDYVKSTKLDKSIFEQPEGITFSPDGTMYISNERKSKSPNILIFESLENIFE